MNTDKNPMSSERAVSAGPRFAPDGMMVSDVSEAVIGAAMKVLNTLKAGLNEKAYENALAIELARHGRRADQQKRFDVLYDGQVVDVLVPDLIVDDAVVVDPKVVEDFAPTHVAQMIGYLAITKLRVALLLNFKHADLRWKRVVR